MRFLFLVYGAVILFGVTFYTMASMGYSSSGGSGRGWGGSSGSGWSSGGGHK